MKTRQCAFINDYTQGVEHVVAVLLLFLSHTVLVRDRQARTASTKEPSTVFFTLVFGNFLGMNNGIDSLRRFCDRACVSAHMYVFKSVLDTHTHTHTYTGPNTEMGSSGRWIQYAVGRDGVICVHPHCSRGS